jgi:AcrR family transcriptional regulator
VPRRPRNDPNAPELDRERIVAVSLELIDRDGLDRFSLRALARELGAGNMSVYYYVKDRDALLELVLDEVLGTVDLSALPDDPVDALRVLADRFIGAFTRHPNTIPLFVLQPLLTIGPSGATLFDRFVGLLRQTGADDTVVADTTVALVEYLCGHLLGYLPHMTPVAEHTDAVVDQVLADLGDRAPNIAAIAPALRRTVGDVGAAPGVSLILAGLRATGTPGAPGGASRSAARRRR